MAKAEKGNAGKCYDHAYRGPRFDKPIVLRDASGKPLYTADKK